MPFFCFPLPDTIYLARAQLFFVFGFDHPAIRPTASTPSS
jgi:hypothetical protein